MTIYIVIPAYNEANHISKMLNSLCQQTVLPKKVVVVNDNSTDNTAGLAQTFANKHNFISVIHNKSVKQHQPGAKVINAFYKGYQELDNEYDMICKFDADIILPNNYLEKLTEIFTKNPKAGIVGGLAYIEQNGNWVYENVANKNHVRGPFKAYRKACFEQIGGLKPSIGWDTADVLLAQYYNWQIVTDQSLKVKHLKPTGNTYNKASKHLQGEALYKLRYGFWLSFLSASKMAVKRKGGLVFRDYMLGYFKAKRNKLPYLVNKAQGKFIRRLRWQGIFNKLFKSNPKSKNETHKKPI